MKASNIKAYFGSILLLIFLFSSNNIFAADISLSWDPPVTNEDGTPLNDLEGYNIYYGTASGSYPQKITVGNVTTYQVTGLASGSTYCFAITAYDTSGNESLYSNEICTTIQTPDTTAPVISGVQASGISTSAATIAWTTNEASNTQIEYGTSTSYGSATALNSTLSTAHSQNITGLSSSTLYHYRVRSSDAAGNLAVSADYIFTTATPPDTIPPTIPGNIQASAVSATEVNISWNSSVDNISVAGYRIYRNGIQIATTNSTSYQDSGLLPSTTYTYAVSAYDGAGNLSGLATATITTNQIPSPDIAVSKVLLSEDFSGGIPSAWSSQGNWGTNNSCGKTIDSPFTESFAIVDSSCTETGVDELITEPFNAVSCDSIELSFSTQYYRYSGSVEVALSNDSGTTWTTASITEANDGYPVPAWKDIDISSIAGAEEAQIKFKYSNNDANSYWAIDNVQVTCQTAQLEFSNEAASPGTIIVTNTGNTNLAINTIAIEGADASDFELGSTNNCSGQTLSPGNTCMFDVVFKPVSYGPKNANISISSNDPDSPIFNISLLGTALNINNERISPVPKIKANGSSGIVNIAKGDNLKLTIELNSGSYNGNNADLWVLFNYRERWYYYSAKSINWRRGISTYSQEALSDFGPVEVLNQSNLPKGLYTFYFMIDTNMNGNLDYDSLYQNEVSVEIK
ncbi:MAG: fibronectin type III domain-containing protein [Nitrospirota bacterium]|nr:fibronectin type III domain-containing protein [Nitrospirota bacterium]